jgi:rhodanese-related sulfurtransferase
MAHAMQLPLLPAHRLLQGRPVQSTLSARSPAAAAPRSLRRQHVQASNAAAPGGGDYAAAEKRWQDQLAEGKVRNVTATNAAELMKEGWVLLDVRPPAEIAKAGVVGATEVPIFIEEESNDFESLLKKSSAFGMGGWWLGGTHMKPNADFIRQVQQKVPKDAKVIVACQKGLRSLAAAEQMSRAGYGTLAWINGGLDTAGSDSLPTVDGKDLRYGGVGGVSQLLGWTDVQRAEDKAAGINKSAIFIKIGAAVLLVDAGLFAWEFWNAYQNGTIGPNALH